MQYIVFTDIDGTLVDFETYSPDLSMDAVENLRARRIPLVLCSSKTRLEIEVYRNSLSCVDPFIVENGGGIFIPDGYFLKAELKGESRDGYQVIELGMPYPRLRQILAEIREETGYPLLGMGDMTLSEVCASTGLPPEEAKLARMRDFDEPFTVDGVRPDMSVLWQAAAERGVTITRGGRFFHLIGKNDKGKAVRLLADLFAQEYGEIATIAIGDSPNDIPMLQQVDMPVLVQKPGGYHDSDVRMRDLYLVPGVGPAGWSRAITTLISQD